MCLLKKNTLLGVWIPLLCFHCANHGGKYDNRAKNCVFLGYKARMKGYVAYDYSNKEILISRHVMFYEHICPCIAPNQKATTAHWNYIDLHSTPKPTNEAHPTLSIDSQLPQTPKQPLQEPINTSSNIEPVSNIEPEPYPNAEIEPIPNSDLPNPNETNNDQPILRRSNKLRKEPTYL